MAEEPLRCFLPHFPALVEEKNKKNYGGVSAYFFLPSVFSYLLGPSPIPRAVKMSRGDAAKMSAKKKQVVPTKLEKEADLVMGVSSLFTPCMAFVDILPSRPKC